MKPCTCGRTHPDFPAVPFTHGVLLATYDRILAVVNVAMAKTDSFDAEFEYQLTVDAVTAATPVLISLAPAEVVEPLAEGIARSFVARIRRDLERGQPIHPMGGRIQ